MANRKEPAHKAHDGVIVPLVTPVTDKGELDEGAVRRLVDYMVQGGVQGIFLLGTTGEGPSVPRDMRARLVRVAVEQAQRRAMIYAGIIDSSVYDSVAAGREYLKLGASAVVAQLPNYFVLTPDDQFEYFALLARRIGGPMMLYDMPATARATIDSGVIEHLRAFSNLIGIKDSSGNPQRIEELISSYGGDPNFAVLVGATRLASFGLQRGADGFVPSAANLNPELCCRMCISAANGDWALMNDIQRELDALTAEFMPEDATIGQGIARLKLMMSRRGLCGPRVFPPLQQAS